MKLRSRPQKCNNDTVVEEKMDPACQDTFL